MQKRSDASPGKAPLLLRPVIGVRDWFFRQGMYWMFSAVAHATILLTTLLLLGNVVTEKIHSVAPRFEGTINTEIPGSEFEAFDSSDVQIEPGEVGTDQAPLASSAAEQVASVGDSSSSGESTSGGGSVGDPGSVTGTGTVGDAAVGFGSGSGPGAGGIAGIGGFGGAGGSNLRAVTALTPLGTGGGGVQRSSARHGGVGRAGSVGDAVGGVLAGIKGALEEGDLLVVWLIDESISLKDDRQQIAERIEPFFAEIERRSKNAYKLMNAVVGFGAMTHEIVEPTLFSVKIPKAIRNLPIDSTGKEFVMTAVDAVVQRYGKKWQGGMLIVLWTDESGDDILKLEETIRMCRKRHIVVRVIGPTAVLGSDRGTHHYVDPSSGFAFRLPIKRGPDTVLPEKLWLPYWHDAALPPWVSNGATVAAGMPWYGGPHREGLLSGIGPYALTRLSLETGGKLTLLDHKEDQPPFSLEKMKRYLPDYESYDTYVKMLDAHPLRKAVSTAVSRTYREINFMPPIMTFVTTRTDRYPYTIVNSYYPPPVFRQLLLDEVPKQEHLARIGSVVIEDALASFGENGMEYEYFKERSPRWRAWYDLNRGRLLAMSVRHYEYILCCEDMRRSAFLKPETNRIELLPVGRYRDSKRIEPRAKEAKRLLERCKKENADTPWALLAQWELDHELGLEVKQIVVPPPQPGPPGPPPPPAPTIVLPTL